MNQCCSVVVMMMVSHWIFAYLLMEQWWASYCNLGCQQTHFLCQALTIQYAVTWYVCFNGLSKFGRKVIIFTKRHLNVSVNFLKSRSKYPKTYVTYNRENTKTALAGSKPKLWSSK